MRILTVRVGGILFSDLNIKLQEAKENLRKKAKYEDHLQRLKVFLEQEETNKEKLERQLIKEKKDVAALEGFTLTNIFYTIVGKKLEKLDKEQQEVLAAKLKYKEVLETIEDVKEEVAEYKKKLRLVADAKRQYEEVIREKEQLIHKTNADWSMKLFSFAESEAEVSSQIQEYNEAISAGGEAIKTLEQALKSLDSAKGWSAFDMFGGGLITTAIKHSHFDDAKEHIHQAQKRLRHFQEELLDIENHFKVNVEIGGLLTFADYFFDGIIFDWVVHGKISDCYKHTLKVKDDVSQLLVKLTKERNDLNKELDNIKLQRSEFLETK